MLHEVETICDPTIKKCLLSEPNSDAVVIKPSRHVSLTINT
jgi:hypothetical protein